jgi:hypothetical protein
LWWRNFKSVPHILTASQKLEGAKISRKLFGQFNKLQVNSLARVITGDETSVYFENQRSVILVGADVRRRTRPKPHVGAKTLMFWVCFTPIGILDIGMLPAGETFGRSFLVDIVSDSLKKKVASIPDPNPEKGHLLHLDNARPHMADHEIQGNNLTRLSHPAYSPDLARSTSGVLGI